MRARTAVVSGTVILTAALLVAGIVVRTAPPGRSGPGGIPAGRVDRVLIIAIPAVTWHTLGTTRLPHLDRLLDESAVADLTTRTVNRETKLADGYATLGAGTRAVGSGGVTDGEALEVREQFGSGSASQVFERRTGQAVRHGIVNLGIAPIVDENAQQRFDAEVGALGTALRHAGYSRAVIANADGGDASEPPGFYGRQAAAALMDERGIVPSGRVGPELLRSDPAAPFGVRYDNDTVAAAFRDVWKPRSVVLVEASDLARADAFRPLATSAQRNRLEHDALVRSDRLVGKLLAEVDPRRDAVLVVGPAHPERRVTLAVAALRAPGVEPGLLRSATTRRSGFVQLVDVGPTVLHELGVGRPASMEGRAFELGRVGGSPAERQRFLDDADRAARFRDDLVTAAAVVFIVAVAVVAAGALLVLARPRFDRYRHPLRIAALAALGYLPAILLAQLVPFFRIGAAAYWTFVVTVSAALAALYEWIGRRDPLGSLTAATATIVGILVVDAVLGGPLQFNGALGYSPTVAGRFTGFGNLAFAALAAAAVVLAALIAHRVGGRRGAWLAIALLGAVFVVDGTPFWGSDVGGVLAMVPAFGALAIVLLGRRFRWRAGLLCLAGTTAAVGVFTLIDLARPPNRRTHLGRLFERVDTDGWSGLLTVVERKVSDNVSVLAHSVWTPMVLGAAAFAVYLAARRRAALRSVVERVPELRAAFLGLAVVGVLGFALNDSGIAVPGVIVGVSTASLVTLLVAVREGDGAARVPAHVHTTAFERTAPVGSRV